MNIANKQFHFDIQMNIHTEKDESYYDRVRLNSRELTKIQEI